MLQEAKKVKLDNEVRWEKPAKARTLRAQRAHRKMLNVLRFLHRPRKIRTEEIPLRPEVEVPDYEHFLGVASQMFEFDEDTTGALLYIMNDPESLFHEIRNPVP